MVPEINIPALPSKPYSNINTLSPQTHHSLFSHLQTFSFSKFNFYTFFLLKIQFLYFFLLVHHYGLLKIQVGYIYHVISFLKKHYFETNVVFMTIFFFCLWCYIYIYIALLFGLHFCLSLLVLFLLDDEWKEQVSLHPITVARA